MTEGWHRLVRVPHVWFKPITCSTRYGLNQSIKPCKQAFGKLRLHAFDNQTHNLITALSNWLYQNLERRGPDAWFRENHDIHGPSGDGTTDEPDPNFGPGDYPPMCFDVMRMFWYCMTKGSVLNTAVQPQVCVCVMFLWFSCMV